MAKSIEEIMRRLQKRDKNARMSGLEQILKEMKKRIFSEGKASNLTSLGAYRSGWAAVRLKAGKQVSKKDLSFRGNLEDDLEISGTVKSPVIGFKGGTAYNGRSLLKVADGQEKQTGKTIWEPSRKEIIAGVKEYVSKLIKG